MGGGQPYLEYGKWGQMPRYVRSTEWQLER
jgi:hypothetical protein